MQILSQRIGDQLPVAASIRNGQVELVTRALRPNGIEAWRISPVEVPTHSNLEGGATDAAVALDGESLFVTTSVERTYFPWDALSEAPREDISLAKVALDGGVDWQVNLAQLGFEAPDKVLASPGGGAVALGVDRGNDALLVWSVSPNGETRWTRSFGTSPGGIVALPGNELGVLGTLGTGTSTNYNEDVVLWILDAADGAIKRSLSVRQSINTRYANYFFQGSVVATDDSMVAASEWSDRFTGTKLLEVASFEFNGTRRWVAPLPYANCKATLFAERDGDVLLACKEPELSEGLPYFDLIELDGKTGSSRIEKIRAPDCSDPKYWLKAVIASVDGSLATLVGYQPIPGDRGPFQTFCWWAGRIDLTWED
jgi:hypothetical protein